MDFLHLALEHGVYVTIAVVTFISAIFPIINAELAVLAVAAAFPNTNLVLLVLSATGAQMAGKSAMYWVGRSGSTLATGKYALAIERWGHRFRGSGRSVGALVFVSSASGLPPFYVISTLAGTFRTSFVGFLVAGTAGRFLHFAVLAWAPVVVRALGQ